MKMYKRSVEEKKLYYTSFYGDGDSKSYTAVKDFMVHRNRSKSSNVLDITKEDRMPAQKNTER